MKEFKLEFFQDGYVVRTEYKYFECSALAHDYARIQFGGDKHYDFIRVFSGNDWDYHIDIKND